jgi:WD repeat-containing protein 23
VWDLRVMNTGEKLKNIPVKKSSFDYRVHTWTDSDSFKKGSEGDLSIFTFEGHTTLKTLIRSRFSPAYTGNRYVYTGSACGSVYIYDTKTGQRRQSLSNETLNC